MWSKKELDIMPGVKSQDKHNQKRAPKDIKYPKLPKIPTKDKKYVQAAVAWLAKTKEFQNNPGNVENFFYPISHSSAKTWMRHFVKNNLKTFGPYQDYIDQNEIFGFHSVLSSSLNIGLINPSDVMKEIEKKDVKVPLASLEGYVRQLFWREYQRYTYIYFDWKIVSSPYFSKNTKRLTKGWYDGSVSVGNNPVDTLIKTGFDTGYIHHIGRLMVIGNYMNLTGISPKEGFKWFMEFSCDSYSWVMHQNVYEMVFFVSGGKTMRKPYISSSNYILKMSNYKKGEWSEAWDKHFWDFIDLYKPKLLKFRYAFPFIKK